MIRFFLIVPHGNATYLYTQNNNFRFFTTKTSRQSLQNLMDQVNVDRLQLQPSVHCLSAKIEFETRNEFSRSLVKRWFTTGSLYLVFEVRGNGLILPSNSKIRFHFRSAGCLYMEVKLFQKTLFMFLCSDLKNIIRLLSSKLIFNLYFIYYPSSIYYPDVQTEDVFRLPKTIPSKKKNKKKTKKKPKKNLDFFEESSKSSTTNKITTNLI